MVDPIYIGTTSFGKHYLDRGAAQSWFRMVRDGCPDGGITDALRTQTEQEVLFRKHYTANYAASAKFDRRTWDGQIWWRAYRPGTRTPWPSAATPGSPQARHQKGLSLDLNGATKAWVRANGHRYGWVKDLVGGEDWHMEYQSWKDVILVSSPGQGSGGPAPIPTPPATEIPDLEEIDDMYSDADRARDQNIETVMAERTAKLLDAMDVLLDSAKRPQVVVLFYYTGDGSAYEADITSGTVRRISDPKTLEQRIDILNRTGVTWSWWKGSPEASAVDNLSAFGRVVI